MAFYTQLHMLVGPASELELWYLPRQSKALELAREARAEFIALHNQPAEAVVLGANKFVERMREVVVLFGPSSEEEKRAIAEKMKSFG